VADVWSLLGFARRKLGRFEAAEAAYAEALALDPRHSGALSYLGALRVEQGDLEAARALLARLETACFGVCPERDELAAAIDAAAGD
jgi:Flp pilus assembly protein TadD